MNMTPKEYNRYVARLAKKSPLGKDLLNSFLIGGLICVVGQLILNGYTVQHEKVQLFLALFLVDGGQEHPARFLPHHLSGRQRGQFPTGL